MEFLFPYAYPVAEMQQRLKDNGLKLVLHNLPAGDWDAGERGLACEPERVDEFRDGVARASSTPRRWACRTSTAWPARRRPAWTTPRCASTFVANLRYAAAELKKAGLNLLIEPINRFDIPGFYLNTTAQALSILDEVGADNAYVQYDIYHAQRMEGELADTMSQHLARIGHIQLADNPGRNEPGTGEINYAFLFAHLDRIGYTGWIGCEYKPAAAHRGRPGLDPARWRD